MLQSCSFRHPVPRLVYPLGLGNPQVDPQCSKKKHHQKKCKKKIILLLSIHSCFHLCFTTSSAVRCNPFAHGTLPNRYAMLGILPMSPGWPCGILFFRHPVPRLVYPPCLGNPQVDPQFQWTAVQKQKKKRGSSLPTLILLLKDHRSSVSHIMFSLVRAN